MSRFPNYQLLMTVLLIFAWLHTGAEARPVRIMPLGDSITYGESGAGGFGGYRRLLYYGLVNAGYSIDYVGTASDNSESIPDRNHEGHAGWRIDQIYANIEGWFNSVATPDIILLHIGTNDFGQWFDTLNAIHRLDALIIKMAILRPDAHIIVTTLLPRHEPQNSVIGVQFNPFVQDLVEAHIDAGRLVSFLDMHAVVSLSDMPDQLHPNQTGYNKMAAAWYDAIEAIIEPGDAVPPSIVQAVGTGSRIETVITFNRRLDQSSAETISNYSIDQNLGVHSAKLSSYGRVVTLVTDPQALGTNFTLTVNGLVDKVLPTPNAITPNSTVTFFPPTRSGYFNNVDESNCYTLLQSLDISNTPDFSDGAVPYTLDYRNRVGSFDRVAYYLELKAPGGDLQYAWASMDAFTMDASMLGVPSATNGAVFQQAVDHLNLASNVAGLGSGSDRQGNIEFWPGNYSAANTFPVPGASSSKLDFGDSNSVSGNYGSMQIHDTGRGQTLIAFNRWGGIGGDADIGIGNRPSGDPDWTLAQNAAEFEVKRLQVLVRTTGDSIPPMLESAMSDDSRFEITVRFDEPVRRDTLIPANFSLDQGVSVLGIRIGEDLHEVILLTTVQPATRMTLTVSQVRDSSQNANQIATASVIAVSKPPLPAAVLANIGAAADDYELVYTLEIPTIGDFNASNPYLVDNHAVDGSFTKLAYYLELQKEGGPVEYVWISMDAFTSRKSQIGIPSFASGARFQQPVTGLEVISNTAGIVSGSWLTGGNLEFWPTSYIPGNAAGVPGASASTYDFGDQRQTTGNYGSMQIHNAAASQTLFAINGWGSDGRVLDLGIGNHNISHPDWTSSENAGTFSRKRLHVMVLPAGPAPVPAEVLARVPESIGYELVYSLDIPANGNLSGGSGMTPYSVDLSGNTGSFSRVAYYIELQKSGDPEPTFAWVSLDAFTDDRSKIGVPNLNSGAIFQQLATNLNIVSNSGIATGSGLEGNLEFWPGDYTRNNSLPVPGASGSIYDFGDDPAPGDYGSMQIHNHVAGETIFAINHWGSTGNTINPLCLGIGSNPDPIDGATDYTHADNAPSFDLVRKLHVFVLPGDSPINAPQFIKSYPSAGLDRLLLTFDRELSDASAHASHFSIDGGLHATGASLLPGNREIALTTTPQSPGRTYNLTANGVTSRARAGTKMRAGASIQFTAYTPPDILVNIPDPGYDLIYELAIPSAPPRWNHQVIPYSIDETIFGEHPFDRVAYLLELDDTWIFISFDAHTDTLSKIGVPTSGVTATPFQRFVTNMNVASNLPGIVTGNGINTGNIEFWSGDYQQARSIGIPNSSGSSYDFGDRMIPGTHGTMQVHNHGASQTLFAYNDWGSNSGGVSEIGIGNNSGGIHPDWTSSDNASSWNMRNLYVFARSGGSASASKPEILSNPCDRTAPAGAQVTFSINLHGEGPFAFQWRRDGVALAGETQSWLELNSISAGDVADYDVLVTGPNFASVTSRAASLTLADSGPSPLDLWRSANGFLPSDGDLDDREGDGLANLIEFALGTDPNLNDQRPLAIDGTVNGTPIIDSRDGLTFDALFVRRDDHGQSGSVSYTVEFSSDLTRFHASTSPPTFVSDSSDHPAYELVRVPFPATTPDGSRAQYFRVKVQLVP